MSLKAKFEETATLRQDCLDKAQAILDTADKSDDGLTEELQAKFDELTAKAEEHQATLDELKKRDEQTKARLEKLQGFQPVASDGIGRAVIGSSPREPEAKTKIPATVRRHSRLQNFTGEVNGMQPEERAYRFGQYAFALMERQMPSVFAGRFPHARQFAADHFGIQPYAAHYEGGSDTSGSHVFVPDEFGMDLIRLREQYGVARRVLRVRSMSSDVRTDPRRTGGLTAYFVGESAQITESTAGYDAVTITAKKMGAIAVMSTELDEDAAIDFGDELAGEISYAFANKEDDCLFNGDGTSTYGGMTGVITQLDTLTAATAPGLVDGASGGWSGLTLANFEDAVGNLPQYADIPGQVAWYCHKAFAWSVMKRLALAAGGNTADDIQGGGGGMSFLGYPVIVSQVFPSSTDNDHIPVVFGNLNLAARMGDRRMERIEFSRDATVNSQNLFEEDLMAIKGTSRFGITVHDFGDGSTAGPVIGIETNA